MDVRTTNTTTTVEEVAITPRRGQYTTKSKKRWLKKKAEYERRKHELWLASLTRKQRAAYEAGQKSGVS